MAVAVGYQLYSVQIGATHIPVSSSQTSPGVQAMLVKGGSTVDPTVAAVGGTIPIANFTTPAVATALAVCGTGSNNSLIIATTAVLTYVKLAPGVSYSAGADSKKLTINEGMVIWNGVSGDSNSPAQSSYSVYATYDDTNAPFILAATTAPDLSASQLDECYRLYAVVVDGTQVPISSGSFQYNTGPFHTRSGASIYPTNAAVSSLNPRIQFTTPAVKTAINLISGGDTAGAIATPLDGLAATEVALWFAEMDEGGFKAGSTHIKIALATTITVLQGIDAQHNQVATATYETTATQNGVTEAVIVSTTEALVAGVTLSELYTAGPGIFDSTTFDTMGWSFASGIDVKTLSANGEVIPTLASIGARRPSFTAQVLDVGQLPPFGQTEASAKFFLKKIVIGGERTGDAVAEHIGLTALLAVSYETGETGTSGDVATVEVMVDPVKSGSNEIVAMHTLQAIA